MNGTLDDIRRSSPPLVGEPGVRFGIAHAVVVLALLASAAAHLGLEATTALIGLIAGLASAGVPGRFAVGLGLGAWAMVTGFVENGFGELTFSHDDVLRLAVLVAAVATLSRLLPHLGPHGQGTR